MKKTFAVILALTLVLALTACVSTQERKDFVDLPVQTTAPADTQPAPTTEAATQPAPTTEAATQPAPTTEPATQPAPTTEPATQPVVQPANFFRNETNNSYDVNSVSVKPRYVYWDNGQLVAECFVINGFGHTVYNIEVESLSFSNRTTPLASASFGVLNGLSLAPYTHAVWTFRFPADCVTGYGGDLSFLSCNSSVNNNY